MPIDADAGRTKQPLALLVERDESSRLVCRATLSEAGFEVITASDAATALLIAGFTRPDVMLLDVDGPATSSLALSRDVRADNHLCRTRIIALTSELTPHNEFELHTTRFDQILVRPAGPQQILQVLGGALVPA